MITLKPLRYPTTREMSEYMRMRQKQNNARGLTAAESMALKYLETHTPHRWGHNAMWGYRLFDFWNAQTGVAFEIDGPEHNEQYDAYRDEYNFIRSGIVVLRVKNFDMRGMAVAVDKLSTFHPWSERRQIMGIKDLGKGARMQIARSGFVCDTSHLKAYIQDPFGLGVGITKRSMGARSMDLFEGLLPPIR
jgi:very-short-patch-repair endonuclease